MSKCSGSLVSSQTQPNVNVLCNYSIKAQSIVIFKKVSTKCDFKSSIKECVHEKSDGSGRGTHL